MSFFTPPKPKLIDSYSYRVSAITPMFGETELSVATGFFWNLGVKTYLVTNWHNVSGINPLTGKHLSAHAGEPDSIKFDTYSGQDLNRRGSATIILQDIAGPIWLEHPRFGRAVDVVCIELPSLIAGDVFPMNQIEDDKLTTRVADEVFILGYPLGIGIERLPIWKRASVASEIDFDVDNQPKFLVDTASTSGMSGAPVIRRSNVGGLTEDGNFTMSGGAMSRFVGIYSGRVSLNGNLDAQLGIVWKARVVEEIIKGKVKGDRSVPPKPRHGYVTTKVIFDLPT